MTLDLSSFFRSKTERLVDLGRAVLGKEGTVKPFYYDPREHKSLVRVEGSTLHVAALKNDASAESQMNLRRQVYLGAETILERDDLAIEMMPDAEAKGLARVLDTGRLRNTLTDKYVGDRLLFSTEAADAVQTIRESDPATAITNMLALNGSLTLDNSSALALAQLLADREDVCELWSKLDEAGLVRDSLHMRTKQDAAKLGEKLLEFFKANNVEPPPQPEGAGGDGEGESDEGSSSGEGGKPSERGDTASFGKDGASFENVGGALKNELDDPGKQPDCAEGMYDDPPITFWDKTSESAYNNQHAAAEGAHIKTIVDNNDRIGHELTRLLQVRSAARYEHLQKRGKISPSHLYRVALPTMGSGSWNASVFRKKKVSDCLDTAVTLLVDCSGSMTGQKYEAASAAAVLMGNALDTVHVPFEVLGFTDNSSSAIIPVFKSFTSPWVPSNAICAFGNVSWHLNGNPDAVAVDVAGARLAQRNNKRRVMIVLSDGMPASFLLDGAGALKAAVSRAVAAGIEVFGIGINSTAVERFYDHHVVVGDYNTLSSVLLSVLDKQLS